MAEPLKNYFGTGIVYRIATDLRSVYPSFDVERFTARALDGFEDLELTPRGRQIAAAMAEFLPADRGLALDLVVASFGPELENCDPDDAAPPIDDDDNNPMAGFYYMPHGYFISDHGGEHFDQAMRANYELTKRFTAEFSVRAHLRDNPERALALMREWATDPNVHVRRLVSEGTRPRLPWSARLKEFQRDPAPVIVLLEHLKDDPVEYVRRSVANNLNDIAKDHPGLVVEVAKRWWSRADASPSPSDRRRLVRHAMRTLIKAGDAGALDVLGYEANSPVVVGSVTIDPPHVRIGDKAKIQITIENPSAVTAGALVDLRVHFVKANGSTSPKVFKGSELELEAGGTATVRKTISLAQHSTRRHYPGHHVVDVAINGTILPGGSFSLEP